jgi:hypothetical protein
MPFYLRKSVSVGPFRFNLSKSGIGVSAGIKGLRVGTGPRGAYVHMGAGGLYYRTSLGPSRRSSQPTTMPMPGDQGQVAMDSGVYHVEQVETGNILEMTPGDVADIVAQINTKAKMIRWWPWVLAAGLCLAVFVHVKDQPPIATFLVVVGTALLAWYVSTRDQVRKSLVIMYDLEEDARQQYERFTTEFDSLKGASRKWNIDTASYTSDWKRHAGATSLIKRAVADLTYRTPNVVKTNVGVPSIFGGQSSLYFFPDVMLVKQGAHYAAVPYSEVQIEWDTITFVEDGQVPNDSTVIGHTWKHPNKNGGPDRRFRNNRQIPEVRYQTMTVLGPGGFRKMIHISQVVSRKGFNAAIHSLIQTHEKRRQRTP